MIRVLLIPSSDYLGHPFPQRHNHIFERMHDGKEFEVHVVRFTLFDKKRLRSKCIIHELPMELKIGKTGVYYLANIPSFITEILRIIKQESIDILVYGNLLPPLLSELLKRLAERRVPSILDIQDYYPTSATGYISNPDSIPGRILESFFKIMMDTLISYTSAITVPGIALALYVREVTRSKPIHIVPNGVSGHFFKLYLEEGLKIRSKLGFGDEDLVIGYIGSIEFWLDMEPLLKAIANLGERGRRVRLLLVGRGLQSDYPEKVETWLRKYNLSSVSVWLDFIPHEEVPKYVATVDIGTIPFDTCNKTAWYAAPNKLWEYLSQGAEVVSTPIPEALMFRSYIRIAKNWQEYATIFIDIKRLGINQRIEKRKSIEGILFSRTWENSASKIKRLIKYILRDARVRK